MSVPPGFLGAGGFPTPDLYDLDFIHRSWTAAQLATAGFNFARTSTAYDDTLTSYASGVPVITATRGLFIEEARTNFFLGTASPATQAIAGLTGTCVCWVTGSGSVTLSGGATGVASAGSPVVFSPSGSVTFTVAGTVTFASVEQAAFPTLPIVTVGSAVTRNADTLKGTPPWALTSGTILVKGRSAQGLPSGQTFWEVSDGTLNNRIRLDRNTNHALRLLVTSAAVQLLGTNTGANTLSDSTDFAVILAWQAGSYALQSTAGSFTATLAGVPGGMIEERIGHSSAGAQCDSSIYREARWSTVLDATQMAAALAAA